MLTAQIEHQLPQMTLDVEFTIKNEIAVLFGPSGSGKTTILNAVSGLIKLKNANIILNNNYLTRRGKSLVPIQRRKIGYVFQDYALFPHLTIWGNIKYGMKNEAYTMKLVHQLGLEKLLNQYPHEVSGGEQQRTALIRALASEPELLLLDEPFSALDDKTKTLSYEQLLSIHERTKIPILLVSHNRSEVEYLADKIFYMEEGNITRIEDNIS